jgi:hypothetical protein
VVSPVLVTVEAARTPKVLADARGTGAWPAVASWRENSTTAMTAINPKRLNSWFLFTGAFLIKFLSFCDYSDTKNFSIEGASRLTGQAV